MMSKELNDLLRTTEDLLPLLQKFEKQLRELEDNTNRSLLTEEERYQMHVFNQTERSINVARRLLEGIDKEIKVEGNLEKNHNDRYQVEWLELSSGSKVEVWSDDSDCYLPPSSVEHHGSDYYIEVFGKDTNIEGRRVRVK